MSIGGFVFAFMMLEKPMGTVVEGGPTSSPWQLSEASNELEAIDPIKNSGP